MGHYISYNGVTVPMQFDFGNITSTSDIGVARGGSYGYIGTVDAVRIKRGVAFSQMQTSAPKACVSST